MFALFARRESEQAARIIADLKGLLAVRGAQARCLECPAMRSASPGSARTGSLASLLGWLAAPLLD